MREKSPASADLIKSPRPFEKVRRALVSNPQDWSKRK